MRPVVCFAKNIAQPSWLQPCSRHVVAQPRRMLSQICCDATRRAYHLLPFPGAFADGRGSVLLVGAIWSRIPRGHCKHRHTSRRRNTKEREGLSAAADSHLCIMAECITRQRRNIVHKHCILGHLPGSARPNQGQGGFLIFKSGELNDVRSS